MLWEAIDFKNPEVINKNLYNILNLISIWNTKNGSQTHMVDQLSTVFDEIEKELLREPELIMQGQNAYSSLQFAIMV